MPLSDGYETERSLARDGNEIAKAITEYFNDLGIDDKRGFVLLICDMPTGTVQFMSDLKRDVSDAVIKAWIANNSPSANDTH